MVLMFGHKTAGLASIFFVSLSLSLAWKKVLWYDEALLGCLMLPRRSSSFFIYCDHTWHREPQPIPHFQTI